LAGKNILSSKKIVFFDWNGTFIDDEVATVEAFREVLRGVGDKRVNLSTGELTRIHSEIFEIPLSNMYDKIGFSEEQKKLSSEKHFWADSYNKAIPSIKMHTGINKSLEILEKNSIEFGILSNHTSSDIEDKLQKLGLNNIPVLANDHSGQAHFQGKLHRVEKYQDQHPEIEILAVIGDSAEEVDIAKAIDAISIAFTNGWVRADRIKPSNPDYLIDSSELPNVLKSIFLA
jgi:phosphoglycolate phosphatase-like HAD superfamily hydrolase